MLTYCIDTLQDAYALIERYKLLTLDWGHGSASGFAARLLIERGRSFDVGELATMVEEYKERCLAHARGEVDERLVHEARLIHNGLEAARQARTRLAAHVRAVMYATYGGGWAWKAIAELATMLPAYRLQMDQHLQRELLSHIADILEGLESLEGDFFDTRSEPPYSPGEDELLDTSIRMDIERLDQLFGEVVPGIDSASHCVVAALFALARDKAFRSRLAVWTASAAASTVNTRCACQRLRMRLHSLEHRGGGLTSHIQSCTCRTRTSLH